MFDTIFYLIKNSTGQCPKVCSLSRALFFFSFVYSSQFHGDRPSVNAREELIDLHNIISTDIVWPGQETLIMRNHLELTIIECISDWTCNVYMNSLLVDNESSFQFIYIMNNAHQHITEKKKSYSKYIAFLESPLITSKTKQMICKRKINDDDW